MKDLKSQIRNNFEGKKRRKKEQTDYSTSIILSYISKKNKKNK